MATESVSKNIGHVESYSAISAVPSVLEDQDGLLKQHMPVSVSRLSPEERVQAEKKLVRRIDFLLMPLLVLFYILNYLDRQNIASARLATLEKDLGLTGIQYQTCVSILFVGYILMQIPSNLILGRLTRPAWYLCGCMAGWGLLSACTGATRSYGGLLACRFLLGFLESAFFPGAVYYLSCFYTKKELGLRTAILYSGSQLGNAFGGLLAIAILQMDGKRGIAGWRWLFILEGVVTVVIALLSMLILPDFPATYSGFNSDERDLALWRLEEDAGETDEADNAATRLSGLKLAVLDPKTWLICAILFFTYIAAAVNNFFPSVVKTLGYSRNVTLLLTAPPYVLCCFVMMANGMHADKTDDRTYHIAIPLAVTVAANILAATTTATAPRYVAMMLMPSSFYAASIVTLAWISQTLNRPAVKRAAAIALINAIANTPNIWTSYLYTHAPRYLIAFIVNVVAAAVAIAATLALRVYLARQNRRIDSGEFDRLGASGPSAKQIQMGFRYVL